MQKAAPSSKDNRHHLLEQALSLFAERGYSSVGVQEIVTRSGVTKPTLYHYFGSKEGLLQALYAEYCRSLITHLRDLGQWQGDLIRSLEAFSRCWIDAARQNPEFFSLYTSMCYLPPGHEARAIVAPWQSELQGLFEETFTQATPQHGNLRGHAAHLARSFEARLHQSVRDLLEGRLNEQQDSAHRLVKQFMYGIYSL